VQIYRDQFKVIQNILFLMFQQIVPEGGFKDHNAKTKGTTTFKSLKT